MLLKTRVLWAYRPVRMLAREGQHSDVGIEALGYDVPSRRSVDHTCGIRVGPIVAILWSSVSTITIVGRPSPGGAATDGAVAGGRPISVPLAASAANAASSALTRIAASQDACASRHRGCPRIEE